MVFNIQKGTLKIDNPFLTNICILNPLKTPENQTFSDVFKEY